MHSGSAPSPFDAANGGRLAGWDGSHPLHDIRIEDLLTPASGDISGSIKLDGPVRVGEPVRGTVELVARDGIKARKAYLRLGGLRLVEQRKSVTHRNGNSTRTESWVEANGSLFVESPFLEPRIPNELAAGERFTTAFAIPGPALGPPTAHLGEAIVAWAIEVRFDIERAFDAHLAILLPVGQHPDLLAAGVGEQGGESMLETVKAEDGTITVDTDLPALPGSVLGVRTVWPGASSGDARVELHRRSNAPNGINAIIASVSATGADLAAGASRVELALPSDLSPSFDGAGLQLWYIVRVLVDRRFRPDDAIERVVAIA